MKPISQASILALALTFFIHAQPAKAADSHNNADAGHSTAVGNKMSAAAASDDVTPEDSLQKLVEGNKRFIAHTYRTDGVSDLDIRRLSKGQHPYAVVLGCSDSRVPTEVVFDQKLGEIFVIRTAGEALDSSVIGSVEYAIAHLGSHLIVVMGHTSCGAITAAAQQLENNKRADTPALESVLHDIEYRISGFKGHSTSHYAKEAAANAEGVAQDLLFRSSLLREKADHGDFKIVSAVYDIDNGKVTFNELTDLAGKKTTPVGASKKN